MLFILEVFTLLGVPIRWEPLNFFLGRMSLLSVLRQSAERQTRLSGRRVELTTDDGSAWKYDALTHHTTEWEYLHLIIFVLTTSVHLMEIKAAKLPFILYKGLFPVFSTLPNFSALTLFHL